MTHSERDPSGCIIPFLGRFSGNFARKLVKKRNMYGVIQMIDTIFEKRAYHVCVDDGAAV